MCTFTTHFLLCSRLMFCYLTFILRGGNVGGGDWAGIHKDFVPKFLKKKPIINSIYEKKNTKKWVMAKFSNSKHLVVAVVEFFSVCVHLKARIKGSLPNENKIV